MFDWLRVAPVPRQFLHISPPANHALFESVAHVGTLCVRKTMKEPKTGSGSGELFKLVLIRRYLQRSNVECPLQNEIPLEWLCGLYQM